MITFILAGLAVLAVIGVAVGVYDARRTEQLRAQAHERYQRYLATHHGGPDRPPDDDDPGF